MGQTPRRESEGSFGAGGSQGMLTGWADQLNVPVQAPLDNNLLENSTALPLCNLRGYHAHAGQLAPNSYAAKRGPRGAWDENYGTVDVRP